jgi:hypothetical protein
MQTPIVMSPNGRLMTNGWQCSPAGHAFGSVRSHIRSSLVPHEAPKHTEPVKIAGSTVGQLLGLKPVKKPQQDMPFVQ